MTTKARSSFEIVVTFPLLRDNSYSNVFFWERRLVCDNQVLYNSNMDIEMFLLTPQDIILVSSNLIL